MIPPEDIDDLGVPVDQLQKIFDEKITSENLKNHSLASAAVLRGVARKFGLNADNYYECSCLRTI